MKSVRRHRLLLMHSLRSNSEQNYRKLLLSVLDSSVYLSQYRPLILGLLRSKNFKGLLDFADSLGETEYLSAAQHFAANQLAALIKKYPFDGPIPGIDPEKKAIEVFLDAERRCKRYNLIFSLEHKLARRRHSFIRDKSREWIRKVIGETPNLPAVYDLCGFGPGASIGVSGNATHLAAKYLAANWSVSASALPFANAAMKRDLHVWELLLKKEGYPIVGLDPVNFDLAFLQRTRKVTHNKIALVPKTAKVHRTIAVEPLLNGYVQKGVDEYLRRCLYRHGIDLKDQSRNQQLARLGSIEGDNPFCTIDLSSASDSISVGLARDVLPPDWFSFLNSIRSHRYLLGGESKTYHKFVSMGNGFCFPLETLIFSSVCVAAYDEAKLPFDFSVYGDDIIVRQSVAPRVLQILRALGFRHNSDKTFLKGPFRESCGADWYLGKDVRPVTLDYKLDSLENVIKLHNLVQKEGLTALLFYETREFLKSLIPPQFRYCRPYKGDAFTALEVGMDEFMASPFSFYDYRTWSWRWKELVVLPISDNGLGKDYRFPTVLVMSALRGNSSHAPFTKRRNARTRTRLISSHGGFSTWLPSQD